MSEADELRRCEILVPGPAEALAGLLDLSEAQAPRDGEPLPPLWHWTYLLDRPAQRDLGPDGHPLRGAIPAPPGQGRRRMFAGGVVRAVAPLLLGRETERRSRVIGEVEKEGRSGRLTFVTVLHEYSQDGAVVVSDEQSIVYRDAVAPAAASPAGAPRAGGEGDATARTADDGSAGWTSVQHAVDPTLLFRFSALTYNGHRIHYDREYATGVEGYPGLVVHGPLQALYMTELARGSASPGWERGYVFEYRLKSPLFDHEGLSAVTRSTAAGAWQTEIRDASGRVTAAGTYTPAVG